MGNQRQPNIFSYASSELSQDAFLVWFLQWADPANKQHDDALHKCAQGFIRALLPEKTSTPLEIRTVRARRKGEHRNIDVWAEINDDLLLIIEDKVDSAEHSSQLERYSEQEKRWCAERGREPRYVYMKTGSGDSHSIQSINDKGFTFIRGKALLDTLSRYTANNAILVDFRDNLQTRLEAEQSFASRAIWDWSVDSWRGFYQFLEKELMPPVHWGYVPQKDGGFWGLWWHFLSWRGSTVYLNRAHYA